MINRVVLVGRLTRDPELRYTQGGNGVAVTRFTVAVNRTFTNSQGERDADFITCQLWRKAAENFCKFTSKGSLVGIDGRIQTSSYEKDGQRVYRTDVVAENFSLLESRHEAEERQQHSNQNQLGTNSNTNYGNSNGNQMGDRNQNTNSSGNKTSDPFADNSKPIDISDDDLPF